MSVINLTHCKSIFFFSIAHSLLLTRHDEEEEDGDDESRGPQMRSCSSLEKHFETSAVLPGTERCVIHTAHFVERWVCVCEWVILLKSCKGGALVTSPDFEVGGKEGGRGHGGGVRRAYPTACVDSAVKTQIHDTVCLCEVITYGNSARIFSTAPYPYMARGRTGLRTALSSSWSGLDFLAEVRTFWFRTGVRGVGGEGYWMRAVTGFVW